MGSIKYITSSFEEKVNFRREMNGNGIGRGRDSSEAIDSLEDLIQERKNMLFQASLHWKATFSNEEESALLNLREIWTKNKIKNEHKNCWLEDEKIVNKLDFLKYRMKRGDFKDDLPEDYEFSKEYNNDSI